MVNYSMSGRTYRYSEAPALYPFGFGLSYTSFHYSDLLVPKTLTPGHDLPLTVTVNNTGSYPADEVSEGSVGVSGWFSGWASGEVSGCVSLWPVGRSVG